MTTTQSFTPCLLQKRWFASSSLKASQHNKPLKSTTIHLLRCLRGLLQRLCTQPALPGGGCLRGGCFRCAVLCYAVCCVHILSGVVPMGLTSSMGLLRMKSAQCLGIRLASVTASQQASRATWGGGGGVRRGSVGWVGGWWGWGIVLVLMLVWCVRWVVVVVGVLWSVVVLRWQTEGKHACSASRSDWQAPGGSTTPPSQGCWIVSSPVWYGAVLRCVGHGHQPSRSP